MKIKTLGELIDYVGDSPFEIVTWGCNAQLVAIDGKLGLVYQKAKDNPYLALKCMGFIRENEDTVVDLEVKKLNKVNTLKRENTLEEREGALSDEFVEYAKTTFGADVIIKPAKETSDTFEDLFGNVDDLEVDKIDAIKASEHIRAIIDEEE